jgi:group II intron reverse transcriptase/maturase
MSTKPTTPKTEQELRFILDSLYQKAKLDQQNGELPKFKNLLEIASSEPVIMSAIHKIKANKGSRTAGVDGKTMREFLEMDTEEVFHIIKKQLGNYHPDKIRRKYIDKGNGKQRPLGIPTITDRIIQECVRTVIEPIVEAQFFEHSYGFRPMRTAHQAMERVKWITHKTGYKWVIEGDIKGFFDNVNHTILIKRLWHMGIHDKRILMIIKQMLKAGVMNECEVNELGTPQGSIISPLLANVYLDALDQWITREWEHKKLRYNYTDPSNRLRAMKSTNLKPCYFVRYADDWVLVTNTRENAEKLKYKISKWLKTNLKLELSEEKTLITNIHNRNIHFLGFEHRMIKGRALKGYTSLTRPDREKFRKKIQETLQQTKALRKSTNLEYLVIDIEKLNAKIRGIIQYYEPCANCIYSEARKYAWILERAAYKSIKRWYKVELLPANRSDNLPTLHSKYTRKVPTIEYQGKKIAVTSLGFCEFTPANLKNQKETPFTEEGRNLFAQRMKQLPLKLRADQLFSYTDTMGWRIFSPSNGDPKRNFEYEMNRRYVFNVDKGKCRICGTNLTYDNINTHHIDPQLPLNKVNKVKNLASLCEHCHKLVHNENDESDRLSAKTWSKILKYRQKLRKQKHNTSEKIA